MSPQVKIRRLVAHTPAGAMMGHHGPALLRASTVPQIRESGLGDVRLSLHGQGHQRVPSGGRGLRVRAGAHDPALLLVTMPSRPSSRVALSTAASLRPLGQIGRHDLGSRVVGAYHQGHVVELVAAGPDRHCGTGAEKSAVLTAT